ncbi:MAG: hypothetical protein QOD54_1986 [Sphingomonadales bacterium]|jgi:hypothetical protein|nr:hypothetical protein [Gaiellaceae bacterium]MDX6442541.1 hypothetical protein [Gaiellaceae bacterium]MEA3082280.1 hypothetical protein [Sphingomonadales bacterium]
MPCVPHAAVRGVLLIGVGTLLVAGCGQAKDKGGFSSKDRAAAVVAMRVFSATGVQQAAETYTGEIGQPTTCRIRLESRQQQRFRLYIQWTPKKGSAYGFTWLEAVSSRGFAQASSLHSGTTGTEKAASAHIGDALTPPTEPCHIGIDGSIVPDKAK